MTGKEWRETNGGKRMAWKEIGRRNRLKENGPRKTESRKWDLMKWVQKEC